jgi:hypothetical protein
VGTWYFVKKCLPAEVLKNVGGSLVICLHADLSAEAPFLGAKAEVRKERRREWNKGGSHAKRDPGGSLLAATYNVGPSLVIRYRA